MSVLGEVGFLPLLVLAAKICPPGIEGALFAALMSIFNAGGLVSQEAGALLTDKVFGVSETDFSNLGPLVVTCAASSLLPLVFLGWVREAEQQGGPEVANGSNSSSDDSKALGVELLGGGRGSGGGD
jgi:hypothetical protein